MQCIYIYILYFIQKFPSFLFPTWLSHFLLPLLSPSFLFTSSLTLLPDLSPRRSLLHPVVTSHLSMSPLTNHHTSICQTSVCLSLLFSLPLSLPLSFSCCTCEWKQPPPVFLHLPAHYRPQAATPSHKKGSNKLQEYTCAGCECQSQNQWQPIPGQIMESANLNFRQINMTALSPAPNFGARYKPHYQMRKAISKKKNVDAATIPPAWD